MNERTRLRLTRFSRLWAIPMLLSFAFSILAVYAGMDENKSLMGIGSVGCVLMLVILLCQIVAAIIVRRWWCMAGSVIGIALSLFVLTCSIVALAAGQYRPPVIFDEATDSTEVAAQRSEAAADSAYFLLEEEKLTCHIVTPIPEKSVKKAFVKWLEDNLEGNYRGDKDNLQAMVDFYGRSHVDSLRAMMDEDFPPYAELCFDATVEKVFETEKVVTYELTLYVDFGGAHPSTQVLGATFCKDDGTQLTWDIIRKEQRVAFNDLLRQMLKDYFNADTDDELMDNLQGVDKLSRIPLPATPPHMTKDGITIIYQQYEIAAYAMGMPGDIIPYEKMKPYLTDKAKRLIPLTISDLVSAILTQGEPDEYMDYIHKQWQNFQKGRLYRGRFSVNSSCGYVRHEEKMMNGKRKRMEITEFRYWDCKDLYHKIIAQTFNIYENGVVIDSQYSGISLYVYDAQTCRIELVPIRLFGLEPPDDISNFLSYRLPIEGNDIIATTDDPSKGKQKLVYKWNGNTFNLIAS